MDRVSPAVRSRIMACVRSRDTTPEVRIRKALHRMGYRYVLHSKRLPGRPDVAFPARRKVLFVHGCYWHGHRCRFGRLSKSRVTFWRNKIDGNRARDERRRRELRALGWKTLVVWQCELRSPERLMSKIVGFLEA